MSNSTHWEESPQDSPFVLAEVSRNFAMAGLTSAMAAASVPVIIAASLALTVLLYKRTGDDAPADIVRTHAPG